MLALKRTGIIFLCTLLYMILISFYGKNTQTNSADTYRHIVYANTGMETADAEMSEPVVVELDSFSAKPEEELRILTFNIRSALDEKGNVDLNSVIDEIKELDADIIGLQEVERLMPRSGFSDQPKEIAKALGYNYIYGSNINVFGVRYGNATLSRYPITVSKNHKLPHILLEPRGLLETVIDIEGIKYNVFNTHLGLNVKERELQIGEINKIINKKDENVILLGDFNHAPNGLELLDPDLVDSALSAGNGEAYTFALESDKPNVRIDRIYVSPDINIKENHVLSSQTSDHSRVLTVIDKNKMRFKQE